MVKKKNVAVTPSNQPALPATPAAKPKQLTVKDLKSKKGGAGHVEDADLGKIPIED